MLLHGLKLSVPPQPAHLFAAAVYCRLSVPVTPVAAQVHNKAVFLALLAVRTTQKMMLL
jgi:hypothetical protein